MKYRIIVLMVLTAPIMAQPEVLWISEFTDSTGYFTAVDVLADGGFALAGPTVDNPFRIIKTDSKGDSLWTSSVEMGPDVDNPKVIQTGDGGFLIASGGDPWLIKLDANGEKLWEKPQVDIGLDTAEAFNGYRVEAIIELSDGSAVFAGSLRYDNYYSLFVRTNSSGDILWAKSFGRGSAMSLIQNTSVELVSAGMFTDPVGGGWKMGLMRLSENGDSLSTILYTSAITDTLDFQLLSVQETDNNGYIMAGRAGDDNDNQRYYVVLADADGNMVWEKIYGGDYQGEAYYASQVGEQYLLTGTAVNLTSEMMVPWTLILDSFGDSVWTSDFNQNNGIVFSAKKISDGEYALAGGYIYNWEPFRSNAMLLRLSFNTIDVSPESVHPSQFRLEQNFPNPFNPSTTLSYELPEQSEVNLTVYDLNGREVTKLQNQDQPAGHYEVQWDGVDESGNPVSTGVYFARLQAGDYSKTIKMVYLK